MKTFKLDSNGDRVIVNGRAVMIYDGDCLAQRLQNSIRIDKGSWFLNAEKGIEWMDLLGYKSVSIRRIYLRIKKILESDPEVQSVNSINITNDRTERGLSVSFSVNSIYGEVKGTV